MFGELIVQVIIHGKAYDVTEFLPEHPGIALSRRQGI